jgi:Protein of unknown function (DUF2934)
MATQTDQSPRSNKSRTNSKNKNAQIAHADIVSTTVIKVARQDSEPLTDEQRRELIAVTAYYLAEGRNFEAGHEDEDWLAAEI